MFNIQAANTWAEPAAVWLTHNTAVSAGRLTEDMKLANNTAAAFICYVTAAKVHSDSDWRLQTTEVTLTSSTRGHYCYWTQIAS